MRALGAVVDVEMDVFDVTDGYNVTSAKELAYISNKTGSIFSITEDKTHLDADVKAIWDEFKTNNNLLNVEELKFLAHTTPRLLDSIRETFSSYKSNIQE